MLAPLALAAAVLSACAPPEDPDPTPTAAFADEEEAYAAAEEVYRAYTESFNAVDYQDPATFLELEKFTTGEYRSSEQEGLSEFHASGYVREGNTDLVWFQGTSFSDSEIEARACNDVSGTSVTDTEGNSVVLEGRPDTIAVDLKFKVDHGELRIAAAEATEDDACVP